MKPLSNQLVSTDATLVRISDVILKGIYMHLYRETWTLNLVVTIQYVKRQSNVHGTKCVRRNHMSRKDNLNHRKKMKQPSPGKDNSSKKRKWQRKDWQKRQATIISNACSGRHGRNSLLRRGSRQDWLALLAKGPTGCSSVAVFLASIAAKHKRNSHTR